MADLITLDEYKLLEGINSTQFDEKIESLITRVSALVRTYCNNDFDAYTGSPGYTEYFDIQWDSYVVQLSKSPVISIEHVYERTSYSSAYTELTVPKFEFYLEKLSDSVFRTDSSGCYINFPKGVGSVKINYLAGYSTIPSDLQLAIADIVTYYHKDEWKERQSIGSATRDGAGGSSIRNDPGFPDHIRRVLEMYRTS